MNRDTSRPAVSNRRKPQREPDPFAVQILPSVLAIGGIIGLASAFILTLEKLAILGDPNYVPSCSINPVLNCGSVMTTTQAELFGFPNPLIGLIGFTAILFTGLGLLAGATFARWFWVGLQVGAFLGAIFVHWLIFQSLYTIEALCPYCMAVWIVTIPIFWYLLLFNLQRGHLTTPAGWAPMVRWATRYHTVVLVLWCLLVASLILQAFWSFWTSAL